MRHARMIAVHLTRVAALLAIVAPAVALAHDGVGRSKDIVIDYADRTITYDLKTVTLHRPGGFIITSTTQNHPDVVQLELTVLSTLRSYCRKPAGDYDPPAAFLTLGTPDMPVRQVMVRDFYWGSHIYKSTRWQLPYRSLALDDVSGPLERFSYFSCDGRPFESADQEYEALKLMVTDTTVLKQFYNCRRGIMGLFVSPSDRFSSAVISASIKGQFLDAYYHLCPAILGETPHPAGS